MFRGKGKREYPNKTVYCFLLACFWGTASLAIYHRTDHEGPAWHLLTPNCRAISPALIPFLCSSLNVLVVLRVCQCHSFSHTAGFVSLFFSLHENACIFIVKLNWVNYACLLLVQKHLRKIIFIYEVTLCVLLTAHPEDLGLTPSILLEAHFPSVTPVPGDLLKYCVHVVYL